MGQLLQELHGELTRQQTADLISQYLADGQRLTLRIEDNDEPDRPTLYDVRGARIRRGELQITNGIDWVDVWPGQLLLD